MADVIEVDINQIYKAWRAYLLENSDAEHFGMFNDKSIAEFPYCCLTMLGRPTSVTDLENHEISIDLTFQTDCNINTDKISSLYEMDHACWEFFQELGFSRTGEATLITVSNSNVKRLTSRFVLRNFVGKFLVDLDT